MVEPEYLAQLAEVIAELPALVTVIVLESAAPAPVARPGLRELARLRTVEFNALMARPSLSPNLSMTLQPSDLAQILYTSGTTGRSKGNMFAHTAMLNWDGGAGHGLPRTTPYSSSSRCSTPAPG